MGCRGGAQPAGTDGRALESRLHLVAVWVGKADWAERLFGEVHRALSQQV